MSLYNWFLFKLMPTTSGVIKNTFSVEVLMFRCASRAFTNIVFSILFSFCSKLGKM